MSRADDLVGTLLHDRYRLEAVVTETPDSFVFAGVDVSAERHTPVVVRMARALRGMSNEELASAFDQFAIEAEQLAQVTKASSSTEPLLASGELTTPDNDRLAFCVFSRTDGSSLAQMRGRGAQSLGRAIKALEPVAMALGAAHDQGAFHGDVRPDNLILVEAAQRPTITIVRFTLATRLGAGPRTFAAEYGAPEHFKRSFGDNSVGAATDIYGLALCLVELVTGRPPFDGTHPTEIYKQTTDITRRPTLIGRGVAVSPAVDGVVARALAVNPKLRFATARAFWDALREAAGPEALADSSESLPQVPSSVDPAAAGRAGPPSSDRTPPPTFGDRRLDGAPNLGLPRSVVLGGLGVALVTFVLGLTLIIASLSRHRVREATSADASSPNAAALRVVGPSAAKPSETTTPPAPPNVSPTP